DLKVALMAGADQLEILQALGVPERQMVTLAANADAASNVATGRADAYAATSLTVGNLARRSKRVEAATGFADPVVDGQPVRSGGGFTLAKGSEDLRDAVNAALAAYKQTDEWAKALAGYGFSAADLEGAGQKTTEEL